VKIHVVILQIGTEKKLSSDISVKQEPVDDIMLVDSRPPKKRRVFMDAVVVPTLASILAKRPGVVTNEEKEEQMKKLQNVRAGTWNILGC
jgi:hypothetical protein